jgi:hypothetical protein
MNKDEQLCNKLFEFLQALQEIDPAITTVTAIAPDEVYIMGEIFNATQNGELQVQQ